MMATLTVYINGEEVLQYDKNTRHPGKQRQFMDKMDLDMDNGIEINGESISSPDKSQRANYVAMNLLYGIEKEDQGMISATCGYLVNRHSELNQIRSIEEGDKITMDLIYNNIN